MKFRELLSDALSQSYFATETLFDMVDDNALDWKPETGDNWMTNGQLLLHTAWAAGGCIKGFVTGDWSPPKEAEMKEGEEENMLPPAELMPSIDNVAHAKKMLAEDKALAFDLLKQCSDEDLDSKLVSAPWDPREMPLGIRLLEMVNHLSQHKGQLFYYLKLQGKPVNTMHLWGMGDSA